MAFRAAAVYDVASATFIGYAIQKAGTLKLQSTNIWTEGEVDDLNRQLARLNDAENINQFWPDANDPEVQALLADPAFEPSDEFEEIVVQEIDEEKSNIVYDSNNQPVLDESEVVYKDRTIRQPVNNIERGHKALETVARRRAAAHVG